MDKEFKECDQSETTEKLHEKCSDNATEQTGQGASKDEGCDTDQDDFREKWIRALAENENVRRRCEREKEEQLKYSQFAFAKELISIADNLERALLNASEDMEKDSLRHGIELTYKEVVRIFKRFGITKVAALGESFDPHYHQVMFEKEDSSCANHTVIEVLQDGYILHDRLLRPALVSISKSANSPSKE
jgi:molecular chaperone GrpE